MLHFSSQYSQIKDAQAKKYREKLLAYTKHLRAMLGKAVYDAPECSLLLPEDKKEIKIIQKIASGFQSASLRYVIVIGIGGSNLGTKAIYDALGGYTDNVAVEHFPKLICLDTCDAGYIQAVLVTLKKDITSADQYVVNVISKSGGTAETLANTAYLLQAGAKILPDFQKRIVVTTNHDSAMWKMAVEKEYTALEIPKEVGGRYSVFSAVGLFPLACLGIEIRQLVKGAQWALKQGVSDRIENNPSALSAMAIISQYAKGIAIRDTFFFAPALETVGKWYRQLFAESLGKVPMDVKRNARAINLTPTISIGSTDLHSMAQLYLANPASRFTTFVSIKNTVKTPKLDRGEWTDLAEGLKGNTLSKLMDIIYKGVVNTYISKKMPFCQITMKECSPFALGALMQMKMLEVIYCAHLLGVNAFDQPHVELYKKEVRKLLK